MELLVVPLVGILIGLAFAIHLILAGYIYLVAARLSAPIKPRFCRIFFPALIISAVHLYVLPENYAEIYDWGFKRYYSSVGGDIGLKTRMYADLLGPITMYFIVYLILLLALTWFDVQRLKLKETQKNEVKPILTTPPEEILVLVVFFALTVVLLLSGFAGYFGPFLRMIGFPLVFGGFLVSGLAGSFANVWRIDPSRKLFYSRTGIWLPRNRQTRTIDESTEAILREYWTKTASNNGRHRRHWCYTLHLSCAPEVVLVRETEVLPAVHHAEVFAKALNIPLVLVPEKEGVGPEDPSWMGSKGVTPRESNGALFNLLKVDRAHNGGSPSTDKNAGSKESSLHSSRRIATSPLRNYMNQPQGPNRHKKDTA